MYAVSMPSVSRPMEAEIIMPDARAGHKDKGKIDTEKIDTYERGKR